MKMRTFATLLLLCNITIASAGIYLSPLTMNFTAGATPRKDFVVYNTGNQKEYVETRITDITDSKHPKSISDPKKLGLILSPRKFILSPKQKRVVRLSLTKRADKHREKRYTVLFSSVKGKLKEIEKNDTSNNQHFINAGIGLSVAYKSYVFIHPTDMHINVQTNRFRNKLTITNKGNTTIHIKGLKQCSHENDKCEHIPYIAYLTPKNSVTKILPQSKPVTVSYSYAGKKSTINSN